MKDNDLKNIINSIETSFDAKKRMYDNIQKKAIKYEKSHKTKTMIFKIALPVAACFCFFIIGMIYFNSLYNSPIEQTNDMIMQNADEQFNDVGIQDFENRLGITLDAPQNAQGIQYSIVDDEIACVNFEYNGCEYSLLASRLDCDFSGINSEPVSYEEINAQSNAVLYTFNDINIYYKVRWNDEQITYYLFNEGYTDEESIIDLAYQLIELLS